MLVAVVLAALAVWVTARADFLAHPGWLAAQKADLILGPVLVGVYWLRGRPQSRFGPLLIAAGLIGCAPYILQSSGRPVLFATGVLWEAAVYLAVLTLILTFPTGRLEGTAARAILATGVLGAVLNTVTLMLTPRLEGGASISACRDACPPNGLRLMSADASLVVGLGHAIEAIIVVLAIATIALVAWRVVAGTPPRRRALVIGAPVALAYLLSQAAYQGGRLLELEGSGVFPSIRWAVAGTRSAIWYGFFFALIAAELFAGRMLRQVVSDSLRRPALGELEGLLRGPLGDPALRLAFRDRASGRWVDAQGAALEPPAPGSGLRLTEVVRDGHAAAAIVHDAQLSEEPELLQAAGAVVLLVQENADLDAGWKASLSDLRDSRRRIVAASEAERRKLERDLHDGAQQRLVALRIHMAIASEQAADPATGTRLGELEGELDEAIEELRDLAHGIYPSLLADRGLLAALRAVATRSPRAVEVTGRRIGRYPPDVESALYYCCLEAVQNATKHAGPAAHIAARLSADARELRLEVSDDGPGFDVAAVNGGVGLRNMQDRLGAVHGRLEIVTSPGHGTRICGTVPVNGSGP